MCARSSRFARGVFDELAHVKNHPGSLLSAVGLLTLAAFRGSGWSPIQMSHSVAPVVAPVASTSPPVGPIGLLAASAATAHRTAESSSADSYTSAHGGPPAAVPEPCVVAPSRSDPQVEGVMRRASGRQRAPVSHYEAGAAPCPRALHAAVQHSGLSVPPSELSTHNIAELGRLAKWAPPPDAPALSSRQEGPETAAAAAAGGK